MAFLLFYSLSLQPVPVEIVSDPMETTHFAGGSTVLSCTASGLPIPTVVWLKDGVQILDDGRVAISNATLTETSEEGLVQSNLTFSDLQLSDDANYACEAMNAGALGTTFTVTSMPARLIVECKHTQGQSLSFFISLCLSVSVSVSVSLSVSFSLDLCRSQVVSKVLEKPLWKSDILVVKTNYLVYP